MKALTALLPLLLCLPAHAEVYKWTDENGRVHFGDDPGGRKAEVLAAPASPAPSSMPAPAGDVRARQRRLLDAMQADREERERNELAKAAAAAERARKCKRLTDTLQQTEGRVLYETDSEGRDRYLTPEQTRQFIDSLRTKAREQCE